MARSSWGKQQKYVKPPGQIRRSQVITTYGAGAMVDLVDHAVLVGGLDYWSWDPKKGIPTLQEPRLRDVLAERFQDVGRTLSVENAFREPPAGDDKQPSRASGIQVLEFPQWFVCQNPRCRALARSSGLERKAGRYVHHCPGSRRPSECVPVRFVGACRRGHLEEYPWIFFAHRNAERCYAPSLRLLEGATGDFSEIAVVCECGARERLSAALAKEGRPECRGERPWLGSEGREPDCEERLRLLVRTASAESAGDLPQKDDLFFARSAVPRGGLPAKVARLVLAHKLREVRVQVGFTRIEAVTPDLQGEFDLEVQSARLGLTTDWLPASEIHGEGIFLQLDEDAVLEWEGRPEVVARGRELLAGYDSWAAGLPEAPLFPGVRFYLLHSLSHLLISAISLECGYAASAIRERLYCAPPDADPAMAAILLSTGSSGSEGTLGGLVEQGRNLRAHLRRAFDLGLLCSNDPVCGGHSPAGDPAERFLEGAACHGCLFVAECSCERFNRYLDRALVVPTLGHPPQLAFFSEAP